VLQPRTSQGERVHITGSSEVKNLLQAQWTRLRTAVSGIVSRGSLLDELMSTAWRNKEHDNSIITRAFFITRGSTQWVYSAGIIFVSARTNKSHHHHRNWKIQAGWASQTCGPVAETAQLARHLEGVQAPNVTCKRQHVAGHGPSKLQ
jgi:hypothetical protein